MRKNTLLLFISIFVLLFGQTAIAQTPVPMASQPGLTYSEDFADIANWTNNFASGIGANRWLGFAANATGTIPDGVRTTVSTLVFQGTSTSGGVQRGGLAGSNNPAGTIVLLSTGGTSNTSACAIEVFLDFTGTTAGLIGFDWTRVNNSTGDRGGSVRVYTSTDGTTYTELTGAAVNNVINNGGTASGSITNVQLPASFDNSATARVRFYYFNGSTTGTGGSRPKVSIDNLTITAAVSGSPALTGNTAGFTGTFGGIVVGGSSSSSSYTIAGANLTNDIIVHPPAGFEIRTGANPFSTSDITLTQTGGTVNTTTIDVRFTPTGTGPFSGNVVNSSTGASDVNVAVSGNGLSTQPTVQASNVTFATVTASSFTINFNAGDGTNRLVLVKSGSAVDADPVNGTSYTASTTFGSGTQIGTGNYVVYNGTGTSVGVTGLNGGTTYHVAVFEFNGSAGSENYFITAPPTNSQATLASTISVVINKYQNATPDGIELLVVENATDMRGMIIKDFSASMGGDGGGKFQFTTNTLWSGLPSGTLIILRNNATAADSVADDFILDLGLSNTSFFTSLGGTFDIATTEMIMIKYAGSDPAGVNGSMHVLAGGTAGTFFTSAPTPKLIATGTSGTNFFVYANNSTSTISDYNGTDATGGASGLTFGAGNNAQNITYINNLRLLSPVELSSFTSSVNGNNVILNWSTVMEENNSGFDIERKNVAGEWFRLSNVAGNGTSNTAHSYSFEDKNLPTGNYSYRLKQIDYNGNYNYYDLSNEVIVGTPTKYALSQNYPNPFNPTTSINYELPKDNFVSLKIYDMMGREVASLVNNNQLAGFYTVKFDASKLSSGIYFYKLQANDFTATKKLMLLK